MIFLANLLKSIAQLIHMSLNLYMWIIIIRALISWVSPDPRNPVVIILVRLTEPVLRPIRRYVPPWRMGGIDISPLIAILIIIFIDNFLLETLIEYSIKLKGF
ncbi:MAG: YggT family protein [Acidobacteriota bacterium]